jgi:hypothetical protein
MSGPSTRSTVLGGIWASGAASPPASPVTGTTYADTSLSSADIQRALQYKTVLDGADFNEYLRRMSTLIDLCEKWGIMPWSALTAYSIGAVCLASDGGIYQCDVAHTNRNPASTTGFWTNIFTAHTNSHHFSFSARRTTAKTVFRETWTNMNAETVRDPRGVYNATTGRFTAPVNGSYVFNASFSANGARENTRLQLGIRINNVLTAYNPTYKTPGTEDPIVVLTTQPIFMVTGQYAEVWITFRDDSAITVPYMAMNLQLYANTFSGWRVS